MTRSDPTLLLVEDSEDDVFLMKRALRKANITLPLHVAMDGQEALDYLSGNGQYSDRVRFPVPALMFLDLKLPYVHGFEVLQWIRQHEQLRDLPVVVLTSSPEERDLNQARQLGAKAYLVKPPTLEHLTQAMAFLAIQQTEAEAPVAGT